MLIPDRRFRRSTTLRAPALALALIASVTVAVPVAVSFQDVRARTFEVWLDAVTTHVPAARDEATVEIARWSRQDLDSVLDALARRQPDEAIRVRTVSRALVLHMDIALLNRTLTGYTLPPDRTTSPLYADGTEVGQMSGTFHWAFARRLIERLPRGDERAGLARDFYRAAAAVLQLWGEQAELAPHLAAAREVIPDDPVLLMYEGTIHQVNADARSQRYFDLIRERRNRVRIPNSPTPGPALAQPLSAASAPPTATASLQLAERFLRRALAADPALHEARIRLAHVLHERKRDADALVEVGAALTEELPPSLDYYASLVAGRVYRALGNLDSAAVSFSRALATYPDSRAARTALSELALSRGDRAAARALLAPLAGRLPVTAEEPWWLVGRVHEPSAQALVYQWRARLR